MDILLNLLLIILYAFIILVSAFVSIGGGILINDSFNGIVAIIWFFLITGFTIFIIWYLDNKYKLNRFINNNYKKIQQLYNMGTYTDSLGNIHISVFVEKLSDLVWQKMDLIDAPSWKKIIIIRLAFSLCKNKLAQNLSQNEKLYIKSILASVKYLNELKSQIHLLIFKCFKMHEKTLHSKYIQMIYTDDYGNLIYDDFLKELEYFHDRVLLDILMQNDEFAEMTKEEPIVLVGCDSIDTQVIKFNDFTYDDIENWCKEKIIFMCDGKQVDLSKEYLASIKALNLCSYLILQDAVINSNGRNLNLKKSISSLSLLANDENYLNTLKNMKFCAVNFKTLFSKDYIITLCLLFTELYAKKQGGNKNNYIKTQARTPYEFEKICADILVEQGFETKVTKKSGDQGVDVLAQKNGKVVAVQCKLYNRPVGNKAVQEISAGKAYYKADYAIVVSTNNYTTSARQLAQNCEVYLLNVEELKHLDEIINNCG